MDAENLLAKVSDNLWVRRAFGTAYERDGMLIIPVALVMGGGGAGTTRIRRGNPAGLPDSPPGAGATAHDLAPRPAHDPAPQDPGLTDAGGGFGGLVMPAGVYVVKGDKIRWVPAVDVTIIVLASLGFAGVLARTLSRARRHRGQA